MSENWAYNLDMLAQNGVLDFDAPSFVMGQKPRYVGNPETISPFGGEAPHVPKFEEPKTDEFHGHDDNLAKPASWKKWLFGALALGGLVFGGVKFKSKIIPFFKKQFGKLKSISFKDIGTKTADSLKTGWTKLSGWCKTGWSKIKSKKP